MSKIPNHPKSAEKHHKALGALLHEQKDFDNEFRFQIRPGLTDLKVMVKYKIDNTSIANLYQELPIGKIDPNNKLPPIDTIAKKIEAESKYERRS